MIVTNEKPEVAKVTVKQAKGKPQSFYIVGELDIDALKQYFSGLGQQEAKSLTKRIRSSKTPGELTAAPQE